MKVRFSTAAKAYVAAETKYLTAVSPSGARRFRDIVRRARLLVADFPAGGTSHSAIALTGARRAVIDGYLFDYDKIGDVVLIQTVRSSTNIKTIAVEDDRDYEG